MNVKTQIQGGRLAQNHNATVTLKVSTQIKGGKLAANHNVSVR